MNNDRIVGAGRELLGKGESAVGDATGSYRLRADGIVDQVAGTVQNGFGKVKDAVGDMVDDAPDMVGRAVDRSRELGRQGDEAIRDRLGDNGPLYLIGGAIALFALGAFALTRSSAAQAPKPRPAPKKRAPKAAKSKG